MSKDKIKQNIAETIKLLWQFKWYVAFDLLFFIFLLKPENINKFI